MVWPVVAAWAAGTAINAYMNYKANKQQQEAAEAALGAQSAEAQAARDYAQKQGDRASSIIGGAGQAAQDAVSGGASQAGQTYDIGTGQAVTNLEEGLTGANRTIEDAAAAAREDLGAGQLGLEGALMGAYGQAGSEYGQGLGMAQGTLQQLLGEGIDPYDITGRRSRLGELYETGLTPEQLAQDPGYQFRQQQGEQAINRAAAARGGRVSGRTLQELSNFNQGLASQEYGNVFARQAGLASQADQSDLSALMNQAGRTDQANLAAMGLRGSALGQLAGMQYGTGAAMGNLAAQYGSQIAGGRGQLGASLAGLGMQAGLSQAGNQSALGQGLANLYMQGSGRKGALQASTGQNLANLIFGTGTAQGNVLTGQAAQNAQLAQSMMGYYGVPTQYAGAGTAAVGQGIGQGINNLAWLGMMYGQGGGF